MHLNLILSLNQLDEAISLCHSYIAKYEQMIESPPRSRILTSVSVALSIANFMKAPYNDSYSFDTVFVKMDEYYMQSPYTITGSRTSQNIAPWFSLVGTNRDGATEEYIAAMGRAVPHMANVMNGCMTGLDILTLGELYFYKNDMINAGECIARGFTAARRRNQYDICSRALFYMIRIGFACGDYEKIQQAISNLELLLDEKNYLIRNTTYDIVMGWYFIYIGEPESPAEWLKSTFNADAAAYFLENFGNLIKARYYYASKRYKELLEYLIIRRDKELILYGRIETRILEALCHYHLKDRKMALTTLEEAYDLSVSNKLITPFMEFGKEMRPLTDYALRQKSCEIPRT
jgi:LuxR family maltose regulon positive regulatory protein